MSKGNVYTTHITSRLNIYRHTRQGLAELKTYFIYLNHPNPLALKLNSRLLFLTLITKVVSHLLQMSSILRKISNRQLMYKSKQFSFLSKHIPECIVRSIRSRLKRDFMFQKHRLHVWRRGDWVFLSLTETLCLQRSTQQTFFHFYC